MCVGLGDIFGFHSRRKSAKGPSQTMEPKESRQSPPEATNTLSSQNETGKSSGSDIRSVDQNQNPEADNKIVASEPKTKTDVESVPHVRWLINDGEWREMTKSEIQNARQANGQFFSTGYGLTKAITKMHCPSCIDLWQSIIPKKKPSRKIGESCDVSIIE